MRQKLQVVLMVALVMLTIVTVAFAGQQKVWSLQYEYTPERGWMWSDMRQGDGNNFSVGSQVGAQIIGMPGTHVWGIYRDGALVVSGTVVVPGNYFNVNFNYQLTAENDAGHHFQVVVNGLKDAFQVKPIRLQETSQQNENKKIGVVQFQYGTEVLVPQQANKLFIGNDVGVHIFGLVGDCRWHLLRTEKSTTALAAEGTINVLSDGYVNLGYQMVDSDAGCKFLLRVWEDHLPYEPFMDRFQVTTTTQSELSAYPNPFNPTTTITYNLTEKANQLKITIFDLRGRQVALLYDGSQISGQHSIAWNASDIPSGRYFCRFENGSTVHTLRLTLLK